jgi:hypothetical protein
MRVEQIHGLSADGGVNELREWWDLRDVAQVETKVDTFYVGALKGVGRVYQQTFIDTYAKVGFAKLYDRKTPITDEMDPGDRQDMAPPARSHF